MVPIQTLKERLRDTKESIEKYIAENNFASKKILMNEDRIKFLEGEKADLERAIKILESK